MENVGKIFGHKEYVTASWYILCLFGNFGSVVIFSPYFGKLYQEKSGNPGRDGGSRVQKLTQKCRTTAI
jgi:hypothetical protein